MLAQILPLYPLDRPVRLLAPAKVNLFLDILDRRPDGYHNLDAVNVSVDLFDEIDIQLERGADVEIECDTPEIPTDDSNHLVRAARTILEGTGYGISMKLRKRIPVGAGLGGGTADAGVLMRYLSRALRLVERDLLLKAVEVGSDVPYSLVGGEARVQGRGERVERLPDLCPLRLVLVDPGLDHPTGPIYGRLQPSSQRRHPPPDFFIETWESGNLELLGIQMFNAFQDIVFEQVPRLAGLRESLLEKGCLGAALTGTGSHLVGLLPPDFEKIDDWGWNEEDARLTVVETLPSEFNGWFRRL